MTSVSSAAGAPKRFEVNMYNVGFGDCFLLSFVYGDSDVKRVLIDCGTRTENAATMCAVVDQVVADSGGHVDAIVVTHRHLDHLSAFGTNGADAGLASLQPKLVLQPWTEDPHIADNATAPGSPAATDAPTALAAAHVQGLAAAQGFVAAVSGKASVVLPTASAGTQATVDFIASLSITNKPALQCIAGLSGEREFLSHGQTTKLGDLLPGVTVSVLGPPTVEQCPDMVHESTNNPGEFWKLQQGLADALSESEPGVAGVGERLFPDAQTVPVGQAPPEVRWALNNLNDIQDDNVERFVQTVDDGLNNTSLILLFEVNGKAFLFPGDAQWENWQYALSKDDTAEKLKNVGFYKVGHHGSGNATPKDLWKLFQQVGTDAATRMTSRLSVKPVKQWKNVPAPSLLQALGDQTNLQRSDKDTPKGALSVTWGTDL